MVHLLIANETLKEARPMTAYSYSIHGNNVTMVIFVLPLQQAPVSRLVSLEDTYRESLMPICRKNRHHRQGPNSNNSSQLQHI